MSFCSEYESGHVDPEKVAVFFASYASVMLGCGATAERIHRNLARMAKSIDAVLSVIVLPNHVQVSLTDTATGHVCTHSSAIAHIPVSYKINTLLSNLSWKVAEERLSIRDAMRAFGRLIRTRPYDQWKIIWLVVVANASFCRLFGGDLFAMGIVSVATLAGYALKILLLRAKVDMKAVCLICSFISAVIACQGCSLAISHTPDIALGTCVLYLIPGIPYINSVSDMLANHCLCAISRFCYAALLTACIALGLTGAMLLYDLAVIH